MKREREFFALAAVWLACRWQTMGNPVQTPWCNGYAGDLHFSLLGEHDYWKEMQLLCEEEATEQRTRSNNGNQRTAV